MLRNVAMATIFLLPIGLYGIHSGATWWVRLNHRCAAAMWPYVKLLWPLVLSCKSHGCKPANSTSDHICQSVTCHKCKCKRKVIPVFFHNIYGFVRWNRNCRMLSVSHIVDFLNFWFQVSNDSHLILMVGRVKGFKLHHGATFCGSRSNCCWDMAIFSFSKLSLTTILSF